MVGGPLADRSVVHIVGFLVRHLVVFLLATTTLAGVDLSSVINQERFKVPARSTPQQKFRLAREAALDGDPAAQCFLGECYRNGWGCTPNSRNALDWLIRSATNGYHRGQLKAADMALETRNFPLAEKWYTVCARRGEAEAQFRLANLYDAAFKGRGTLQLVKVQIVPNYRTADWYIEGTNHMRTRVYAVAAGYTEAAKWYKKAAAQGHTSAQNNLGVMYALGHGLRADLLEAYKWLRLSAHGSSKDDGYPMKQNLQMLATAMTPKQLEESKLRASK
jgi:TPR repeat protein